MKATALLEAMKTEEEKRLFIESVVKKLEWFIGDAKGRGYNLVSKGEHDGHEKAEKIIISKIVSLLRDGMPLPETYINRLIHYATGKEIVFLEEIYVLLDSLQNSIFVNNLIEEVDKRPFADFTLKRLGVTDRGLDSDHVEPDWLKKKIKGDFLEKIGANERANSLYQEATNDLLPLSKDDKQTTRDVFWLISQKFLAVILDCLEKCGYENGRGLIIQSLIQKIQTLHYFEETESYSIHGVQSSWSLNGDLIKIIHERMRFDGEMRDAFEEAGKRFGEKAMSYGDYEFAKKMPGMNEENQKLCKDASDFIESI